MKSRIIAPFVGALALLAAFVAPTQSSAREQSAERQAMVVVTASSFAALTVVGDAQASGAYAYAAAATNAAVATQNVAVSKAKKKPCVNKKGNRKLGCKQLYEVWPKSNKKKQFGCLNKLWTKESGWNHKARNKVSGAYGIPQAYPDYKMADAGSDWRTNPKTQIKWGLGYIKGRYGTPCKAWVRSEERGWY